MSIISQTTWDKFDPSEQKEIRELYSALLNALKQEQIGSEEHLRLSSIQDRYISLFGKENLQSKPLTYEEDFDEDFNITDHIVKKESTNWEDKWDKTPTKEDDPFIQQPNNYTLYLRPSLPPVEHIEAPKEPWYRRFENKRRNKRK